MQRIDASIRDWRMKVVQPLRVIRHELKVGITPVEAQLSEALRNAIKRDELLAERLQQEALERKFPVEAIGSAAEPLAAATANMAAYASLIGTLPKVLTSPLLHSLNWGGGA